MDKTQRTERSCLNQNRSEAKLGPIVYILYYVTSTARLSLIIFHTCTLRVRVRQTQRECHAMTFRHSRVRVMNQKTSLDNQYSQYEISIHNIPFLKPFLKEKILRSGE